MQTGATAGLYADFEKLLIGYYAYEQELRIYIDTACRHGWCFP